MRSQPRSTEHDFGRVFLPPIRITLSFLVGMLSLAGCTSGTATPGVPHIDRPLVLDSYRSNPCGLLTAQQLQQFGLANASPTVLREQCELDDAISVRRLGLGMTDPNDPLSPQPISQMYKDRKVAPESFGYFNPTLIQGYPAVFADFPDQRSMGTCKITVGVSDTASISVQFSAVPGAGVQPFTGDPCIQARDIADTVVKNLVSKQPS